MNKSRLEAFSDGVIAIIITIMVLELKTPHTTDWEGIKPLVPVLICYLLSFVFIGIYWGNHHHLLHTVSHVTSSMIWANLHLLFWLSLVPFVTGWMGENNFEKVSVAVYAAVLDMCGVAYFILLRIIKNGNKHQPHLLTPLQKQETKGLISLIAYTFAIPLAFYSTTLSCLIFIGIAILWLIPDRNIEQSLKDKG